MTLPVLLPPLPPVLAPLPPLQMPLAGFAHLTDAAVPVTIASPSPAKWRPGLPQPCPKPWAVTEWYPMRTPPEADRMGLYDVKFEQGTGLMAQVRIERHFWTGKNWPTLRGKLTATGWRGVQTPSGEAAP